MWYTVALTYARHALSVAHRAAQTALRATRTGALAAVGAHRVQKFALEVAGGLMVLAGVAQWSVPSALIVGGLAIMAAIEVRS